MGAGGRRAEADGTGVGQCRPLSRTDKRWNHSAFFIVARGALEGGLGVRVLKQRAKRSADIRVLLSCQDGTRSWVQERGRSCPAGTPHLVYGM